MALVRIQVQLFQQANLTTGVTKDVSERDCQTFERMVLKIGASIEFPIDRTICPNTKIFDHRVFKDNKWIIFI